MYYYFYRKKRTKGKRETGHFIPAFTISLRPLPSDLPSIISHSYLSFVACILVIEERIEHIASTKENKNEV
jgi:hypothetical protein